MRFLPLMVMAWRNLWRHRRRTLLTLFSIAFGAFLAILGTAMQDRNWADMIDLAARLGGGHVTLQNPQYLDRPSLIRTVQAANRLGALAKDEPDVQRATVRIMGETMLATAGKSRGAGFIAYDPAQEDAHTLSLLDAIVEGSGFRTAHDKGIILGERLARNLGVGMGKKVVYTVTDRHGEIVSALARVRGILRTGAPTADGALCLLPLDTVRTTLGYAPGEATQVAVFIADERFSDRVAAHLGRRVAPDVAALPWYETQPELATFIAMKVGGMRVMEVFIALLVAAGIFNTIFVSVTERMREFGIMLAIGFSPADLFKLVMAESAWYGLLGLVGAAAITAWPYYYLSQTGIDVTGLYGSSSEVAGIVLPAVMRVGIYGENLLLIAVSVLLATLLAGLYPAWKAGRVEPVETIKLV